MTGRRQFSPHIDVVTQAVDLVLAHLPPRLIQDREGLVNRVFDVLSAGTANPHEALSSSLPPPEAWPRLASHCGSEYFYEDDDDERHPDPTITFVQTLTRLVYQLGNFERMSITSQDLPYVMLVYNGYGQDRDLHRTFENRAYRYDTETWGGFAQSIVWGCKCSTRSLSEDMVRAKGLEIAGDAFDLALFRSGPSDK